MNEKEIEQEILAAARWATGWIPIKKLYQEIASRAAHVIAKKLAEGVVPLGSGIIGIFPDVNGKPYSLIELDRLADLPDGQHLESVTVTKEE